MIKKSIFILLATCCFFKANAQYAVEYVYDDGGNRYKRTIIPLTSPAQGESNAEEQGETQTEKQHIDDPIPSAVDQLGERKVEVYPNPTKGKLLVRITGGGVNDIYFYTIFNTNGVQLYEGEMTPQSDFPIEMGQYPLGIYILVIKCGKEKLTYKIIKE